MDRRTAAARRSTAAISFFPSIGPDRVKLKGKASAIIGLHDEPRLANERAGGNPTHHIGDAFMATEQKTLVVHPGDIIQGTTKDGRNGHLFMVTQCKAWGVGAVQRWYLAGADQEAYHRFAHGEFAVIGAAYMLPPEILQARRDSIANADLVAAAATADAQPGIPEIVGKTIKKVFLSDDPIDPDDPEIDAILFTDNAALVLYGNDEIDRDGITFYVQPPCSSCGCQTYSLARDQDACLCGAGR